MAALSTPSETTLPLHILAIGVVFILALLFRSYLRLSRHSIAHIRGPPVKSTLFGAYTVCT